MIHGYHVIFCTYGFWHPNDPRGAWSDFVGKWELLKFGPASKTLERKLKLTDEEYRQLALAKQSLLYPWSVGKWIVYLDSEEAIVQAIGYVEDNPQKEGRPRQHWSFVLPFGGLNLGAGWISY